MAKNNKQSDFIDVKAIIKQYLNKWYYFVISIVIMGCLGFFVTKLVKPKYQVNASIVLATNSGGSSSMMASAMGMLGDFGGLLGANAEIEDEIVVITSHSVLKEVAKEMGLNIHHDVKTGFLQKEFKFDDYPIQIYPAPGITDTLRTSIIFNIKCNDDKVSVKAKARKKTIVDLKDQSLPLTLDTRYGKFVIDKTSYYPEGESVKTTIKVNSYNFTAESLAENITVDMASKRSNVINLGYKTPYPIFGEKLLDKVIEVYNQRGIEFKNKQNSRTSAFLHERIALAEADLNAAESSLLQYKEKSGIVNLETDAEYAYTLRGENESKLAQELTRADILKSNLDFLKNPDNSYSMLPALAGSAGFNDAVNTYNTLILQRMDLLRTVTPNNSIIVKLDSQIDAMRANIVETMEKSYKNAMISVRDLQKNMAKSNATLGNMPKQLNDFITLSRNKEIKQTIYIYLLKSLEETELAMAKSEPNADILDEAYTMREPLGFSNKLWIVIFVMIGCCIPPVVIYIEDLIKQNKI